MDEQMRVLAGLEPERVFYYFEEICRIPHVSGDTEAISDYIVGFAGVHGLECRRDAAFNVLVRCPASAGYEEAPPVILQGHMDMVPACREDVTFDFYRDPLNLGIEDGYIHANGTTLGGDDGIAVAIMLAILEDPNGKHPALEAVFTVDEEVGLLGASFFDASDLQGKRMLNLDAEAEGCFWVGCAGAVCCETTLPVRRVPAEGLKVTVEISGLKGGHSGTAIHENRANALKLMGRLLGRMSEEFSAESGFYLTALNGGDKETAIAREITAQFLTDEEGLREMRQIASDLEGELIREYAISDDGIRICVREEGWTQEEVLHPTDLSRIIFWLMQVPYGVLKMSTVMEGLVETSCNPGVLCLTESECLIDTTVRSFIDSAKRASAEQVRMLTQFLGGDCVFSGDYPGREPKENSPLRQVCIEVFEKCFGKAPQVTAIHAGLECGLFSEKIPGLDCVSMGPDILDIHTGGERLGIASTERFYRFLLAVLEVLR